MGRILKINDDYFVEFFGNGLRFRKNAGPILEDAQAKLKAIEESMQQTALKVDISVVTVDQFVERFLAYIDQVHTPRTSARYKFIAYHFIKEISPSLSSNRHLREITPQVIALYKERLMQSVPKLKPRMINFSLFLIRGVLDYAINLRWLNDNPASYIAYLPNTNVNAPVVYTSDELAAFQEQLTEPQRDFFDMLLYSGLYVEEIEALDWESVRLDQQEIDVSRVDSNGSCTRTIRMNAQMLDLLRRRFESRAQQLNVFEEVSLPKVINHLKIRNTFAKNLLSKGVSLAQLYRHLALNDIAKIFKYDAYMPLVEEI